MAHTLKEVAIRAGARVQPEAAEKVEVHSLASIASARSGCLIFVDEEKHLDAALRSGASAVIAGEFAEGRSDEMPMLIAKHPRLAFVRAGTLLVHPRRKVLGVHPTAIVDASAKFELGVGVAAHAVIGANVAVGRGTQIGPGVSIGDGVAIGNECVIHANVTIYPGTRIGHRTVIHAGAVLGSDGFGFVRDAESGKYEKFPQIGMLEIGDDVEIGANTTIDRGALETTVIGNGVKLDNLVHVAHNVRIGENVVIAAQTGISGSSVVEEGAVIAGQVGIADHVTVEKGVVLGAQCGVPSGKIVRGAGELFWGTPARPIKQHLKELAALTRLAKKKD